MKAKGDPVMITIGTALAPLRFLGETGGSSIVGEKRFTWNERNLNFTRGILHSKESKIVFIQI